MSNDQLMLVIGRLKPDSDVGKWLAELEFCQITYCQPSEVDCCLERMGVHSQEDDLTGADLPEESEAEQTDTDRMQIPEGIRLEELERTAIEQTLKRYRGNRTRTARSLGVSVRTLQRKLKAWGATSDDCPGSERADEHQRKLQGGDAISQVRSFAVDVNDGS